MEGQVDGVAFLLLILSIPEFEELCQILGSKAAPRMNLSPLFNCVIICK